MIKRAGTLTPRQARGDRPIRAVEGAIITIDGPTASGKSTVAQLIAEQLGYVYLNSGLIYRGLAYILIKQARKHMASSRTKHIHEKGTLTFFQKVVTEYPELLDIQELEKLFQESNLHYRFVKDKGAEMFSGCEHITPFLKTPEIDQAASIIATHASVRQIILDYLRLLADEHDVVADGRDCGTVVFPHAHFKFFLTASTDVRAHRWCHALALQKEKVALSFDECKSIVESRDERDMHRSLAPLKPAADAYIIDSSHMSVQDVVGKIIEIVTAPSTAP